MDKSVRARKLHSLPACMTEQLRQPLVICCLTTGRATIKQPALSFFLGDRLEFSTAETALVPGRCLALRVAGGDAAQRVLRVQQGHRGEPLHVESLGWILPHPQIGPALVQKVIHDLHMRSRFIVSKEQSPLP